MLRSPFQKLTVSVILISATLLSGAQDKIKFGVHADPVISWFSSDVEAVKNVGSRAGFSFGLTVNKFFGPNYAISTGINLISAGGRLVSDSTTVFRTSQAKTLVLKTVQPHEAIIYRIQYLSVPIGLKLQTKQIGYLRVFTDLGMDPKFVLSGKADIPSLGVKGVNANDEVKFFNLGYHVIAGIEYGLGGNTAAVVGLGFENNFLDITEDPGNQPDDKITHKLISFRLGVNF